MMAGHFAVGLASKRLAPRAGLPVLIAAATFLDLVWPPLVLLGIERVEIDPGNTAVTPLDFVHYPYSHSLLTVLAWALAFALVYQFFQRYRRGALVIFFAVASHWLLDFITHRPDLPLAPGSDIYFGLGLWNSVWLTAVVELGLFLGAAKLYADFTRSDTATGKLALWSLVAALLAIQGMAYTGTPPPSADAVAWTGMASWLFLLWAWWIERTRRVPGLAPRR